MKYFLTTPWLQLWEFIQILLIIFIIKIIYNLIGKNICEGRDDSYDVAKNKVQPS